VLYCFPVLYSAVFFPRTARFFPARLYKLDKTYITRDLGLPFSSERLEIKLINLPVLGLVYS
jgi:hypothetical protein